MKPHEAFKYIRPDEVAECWNGVLTDEPGDARYELYDALWRSMEGMKELSELIHIEESAPDDALGLNNLASVWDKFTPEQQARLNELAVQNDYL